jgi:CRISPR-associated endonuclease/helicase Cas3
LAALLKASKKGKPRIELSSWNALDSAWEDLTDGEKLRPGMILIANAKSGCYDVRRGWDPDSLKSVPPVPEPHAGEEGNDDDPLTYPNYTQTLEAHSREVRDRMSEIILALTDLGIDCGAYREALLEAALHHDWGKAHSVFQATVNPEGSGPRLAKSKRRGKHQRKHFRHELASALALLQTGASDLSVYLAAAHHGKVRLSIRALPGEAKPERSGMKFARGIHDSDQMPIVQLDGISKEALTLNLDPMLLGMSANGAPSWMERMLDLRDQLGVFRLAYLEALIVAADRRASADPKEVLS